MKRATEGRSRAGRPLRVDILTSALLAGAAFPAAGTDWQFNPRAELGAEFNDNYLLFASPFEDRIYGGFTNVALQLRYLGLTDDFSVTPAVYASYLPDSTVDNTTDPSVNLSWNHIGQTWKGGLTGVYLRQSIVNADFVNSATVNNQLGNPTPGDSGYFTIRQRRQLAEGTPNFTIDLTQRQHLQVTADYSNVTFEPSLAGLNIGYNSFNGSVGLIEDVTQRMTLAVRGLASQFNPRGGFASTTSYGGVGEWGYHVSQITQAYVRAGALRSSFSSVAGAPAAPSLTGVVAGGGLNWTFQVVQVFLDLTRTVEPNSTGFTVNRDQARLSVSRTFTPKLVAEVGTRLLRDRPTETTLLFADRDYAVGYVNFKWRFLRAWTLNGEYDHTYQHYAALGTQPTVNERSNAVMLSVIFEPNRPF